jgi:hypothetical protein
MIAESETFIPEKSILLGKTKEYIEKQYNIKVLPVSFFFDPSDHIHVEGEWNDVARFEKDLFTLKK